VPPSWHAISVGHVLEDGRQLRSRTEIRDETGSYVVATLQYLLVDEGKGFVVTYSALPQFVAD
jgi:hypothetical protein